MTKSFRTISLNLLLATALSSMEVAQGPADPAPSVEELADRITSVFRPIYWIRSDLVELIKEIPEERRETNVSTLLAIGAGRFWSDACLFSLVGLLRHIDADNQKAWSSYLLGLDTQKNWNGVGYERLLKALVDIDQECRPTCMAIVERVGVPRNWSAWDYEGVIRSLNKLYKERGVHIFKVSATESELLLSAGPADGSAFIQIVRAVRDCEENHRSHLLKQASKFSQGNGWDAEGHALFLRSMEDIWVSGRDYAGKIVLDFKAEAAGKSELEFAIETTRRLPLKPGGSGQGYAYLIKNPLDCGKWKDTGGDEPNDHLVLSSDWVADDYASVVKVLLKIRSEKLAQCKTTEDTRIWVYNSVMCFLSSSYNLNLETEYKTVTDYEVKRIVGSIRDLHKEQSWDGYRFARNMLLFSRIPKKKAIRLIGLADRMATGDSWAGGYKALLNFLKDAPEDNLEEAVKHALTLKKDKVWTPREFRDVLVPLTRYPSVALGAANLTVLMGAYKPWGSADYAEFLEFACSQTKEDGKYQSADVLDEVYALANGKRWSASDLIRLHGYLMGLPNRDHVHYGKSLCGAPDWNVDVVVAVLKTLEKTNPDRLELIAALTQDLADGKTWSGEEYAWIIQTLNSVPYEEVVPVSQETVTLSAEQDWPATDCSQVLLALCHIDRDDRAMCVEQAKDLMKNISAKATHYSDVILNLSTVSKENRPQCVLDVKTLGNRVRSAGHYVELLKILARIPDKNRPSFVTSVRTNTRLASLVGREYIMHLKVLADQHIEGCQRLDTLHKVLMRYHHSVRLKLYDLAQKLDDSMTGAHFVFAAFDRIPADDLDSCVALTKMLAEGKEWQGEDYAKVLLALAKFPQKRRVAQAKVVFQKSKQNKWAYPHEITNALGSGAE